MARRPERNFYEQLRRNLPKTELRLDLVRVENTAGTGTPDVNYCIEGIEGWAELKAWERVRLSGRFTIPALREDQTAWLSRRGRVGGRAHLLCKINKDVVLFDGRLTPAFFNKGLHLAWEDGEKVALGWFKHPVSWDDLARALCRPPATEAQILYNLTFFKDRPGRAGSSNL